MAFIGLVHTYEIKCRHGERKRTIESKISRHGSLEKF